MSTFKNTVSLENRKKNSAIIRKNYKDMIPIILYTTSKDIKLEKSKYLVSKDLVFKKFLYNARKYANLDEKQAIFVLINNTIPDMNASLEMLYEKYKDEDGFLYISISSENCFGLN